jgi:hypothetical protein
MECDGCSVICVGADAAASAAKESAKNVRILLSSASEGGAERSKRARERRQEGERCVKL